MPELPEVEILRRHLEPLLKRRTIRHVTVHRAKVLGNTPVGEFKRRLQGATFQKLERRGKFLLFELQTVRANDRGLLVGHLGMTGRMYLQAAGAKLPKHAAVVFNLGRRVFVFEDTRYFGRLTFDDRSLARLGPEPWGPGFTAAYLAAALRRSSQAIKVKLLDQSLVAGVGNIYASEILFRAGISPRVAANRLTLAQVQRVEAAIRAVLQEAIAGGSTMPLDWVGVGARDGLFYFGRSAKTPDYYTERLQVYDRQGQLCPVCGVGIRRIVQAARSTFYCPNCQKSGARPIKRSTR
jgi:formamidopyrimidine-DNA glycosylase